MKQQQPLYVIDAETARELKAYLTYRNAPVRFVAGLFKIFLGLVLFLAAIGMMASFARFLLGER